MVMEYVAGGEFYTRLRSEKRLDSATSKFYAAQVVLFLEYLHVQDVCYRDLKPENILLDRLGYIKMADFGLSKKVAFKTYTMCGTSEYMAPEIILGGGHGKGVDWWAFGILCYEMLVGQPPWIDGGSGPMEIYQQILSERKVMFPKFVDPSAKALIKLVLVVDLTRRYGCLKAGAADVKGLPWFKGMDWMAIFDRELAAPWVPNLGGDPEEGGYADTSHFDPYPESLEEAPLPEELGVLPAKDPFNEF